MNYNDPNVSIEEFFTYHPVETQERERMHSLVNHHCLHLALLIKTVVEPKDDDFNRMLDSLQIIRMKLNQQITVDEIKHLRLMSGDISLDFKDQ